MALAPAGVGLAVAWGLAALTWWLDRHGADPLPRLAAVTVLAGAAGAAWRWGAGVLWFIASPPSGPGLSDPVVVARALAVLATAAALVVVVLVALGRGCLTDGPSSAALAGLVGGAALAAGRAASVPLLGLALAPPGHPTLGVVLLANVGAWVGLGVGFARVTLRWPLRIARVAGAFAVAVAGGLAALAALGCTAAADGRPWCVIAVAAGLAAIALLALPVGFGLERRIIARQLAEEVSFGVLPEELATVAVSPLRRMRRRWWPRRDERRAVSRLLVDLAFWKQRLVGLDEARSRLFGLEVGRLRQRVRRLLNPEAGEGEAK